MGNTPPLFINQLVHVILRNLLDGCEDPFVLRAAELFFRPQRLTLHAGSLIAADEETVEGASAQPVSPLVVDARPAGARRNRRAQRRQCGKAIGSAATSSTWRSISPPDGAGLAALGEVIERWIAHLCAVEVAVEPLTEAARRRSRLVYRSRCARRLRSATRCGTATSSMSDARERIVGLYRLTLGDAAIVLDKARGEPIYLILAMTPDRMLRMKPQNLVTGLPIAQLEAVVMSSAPALARIAVGVVVERRKAKSPWIDFTWRPVSVLAGLPDALPWTLLSQDDEGATFYAGAADIALYRTETGNYRDNLLAARPSSGWHCARPASSRHLRFSQSLPIPRRARH